MLPDKSERMDDPYRKRWFEFCRSLTPEQTRVLMEGLERKGQRAFRNGIAEGLRQAAAKSEDRDA